MQSIKNVTIVGAGGNLGPAILKALDQDSHFVVSVLSCKSSSATFPSHIKVRKVGDDYPENELLDAFKGQDAVVSVVGFAATLTQKSLIDASIKAGVKCFIPAEFGTKPNIQESGSSVRLHAQKEEVARYLRSQEGKGTTWSAIYPGPFLDWCMRIGFLGFDLKSQKATISDSGNAKWSATNLSTIGLAVARTLHKPEETANKRLCVHSIITSQHEVLAALEKATGKKWDVEHTTTAETATVGKEKWEKGDVRRGTGMLILASHFNDEGDHALSNAESANKLLGLEEDNLDELVAELVKA